ncbi:MAG: PDDEXK nuclease domain-containing protein [Tannerella sp.]|jgi:predicted nuclease of restriction endonuclease-like (RecB) superfamily|nr:PDDEXK nuclease domain-containing protein [Tannerella sp.]
MILKQPNNFNQLVDNVYQTHCLLQQTAQKAVNHFLVIKNWITGFYIVEYEQKGEDRAKYGERLIDEMSKKLKSKRLKGYSPMSLRNCRAFYRAYPQIQQSVIVELQNSGVEIYKQLPFSEIQIQQSETVELTEEYPISNELLLSRLSYTHFVELLRAKEPLERLFYEVETIKNNWSVKELERAFDSGLYVRTGLSANKEAVITKFKNLKPTQTADVVRDPYFLEFLGLEEKTEYSETELEELILNHLQQFLVELGTGFCFEARQKRITFDNTHYRIDLVFYHRILKSHILIDLKIGKFTHADAGQMTVYLNYYKDNEMTEGDNPPVGIILCGDKNETLVKYATSTDNQLFVSQYLVQLPEKKVFENFMKRELNQ